MTVAEWTEHINIWKGRHFLEQSSVVPLAHILGEYITAEDIATARADNFQDWSENLNNLFAALATAFPHHDIEMAIWADLANPLILMIQPHTNA